LVSSVAVKSIEERKEKEAPKLLNGLLNQCIQEFIMN